MQLALGTCAQDTQYLEPNMAGKPRTTAAAATGAASTTTDGTAAATSETTGLDTQQTSAAAAGDTGQPTGVATVAAIGPDEAANADALGELLGNEPKFPLTLKVTNEMPQRLVIPGVSGLFLGHVAGKAEDKTRVVVFKSMDLLHRMTVDVQAIASLSGHKKGVLLEQVDPA